MAIFSVTVIHPSVCRPQTIIRCEQEKCCVLSPLLKNKLNSGSVANLQSHSKYAKNPQQTFGFFGPAYDSESDQYSTLFSHQLLNSVVNR